ncbi:MAG: PepSY domain-containing protein [Perlucidibaca sp.]
MKPGLNIRRWYAVHKWSSLICTIFMLLLCLTGLPLVFHHEIESWLGDDRHVTAANTVTAPNLDTMVAQALERNPDRQARVLSWDPEEGHVNVVMAPPGRDRDFAAFRITEFDAASGHMLPPDASQGELDFMTLMFRLHTDLFAGLPGMLFLGLMGLLLLASIASGLVLYGPFMRKLEFGTVRKTQSPRLKWLDLHNLLGIVTLCWFLVVGATGVINTLSTPLIQLWSLGELSEMVAPYRDKPEPAHLASVQEAVTTARTALPGMEPSMVLWPGYLVEANRHHYMVMMRGTTPLTSRLLKPVLIEADSGAFYMARDLPWYLSGLLLSQPLHFGDYGGLPLKVLWTLLDLITIVVLVSGLYLWLARRRQTEARVARLAERAMAAGITTKGAG